MDVSPAALLEERLPEIRGASRLVLLLDYDGTLVSHAATPDLARPDDALLELLRRLATRPRTDVHIVSGRTGPFLQTWLAGLPLYLHAEHGALSRGPHHDRWTRRPVPSAAWQERARPVLAAYAARTPGALVEPKETGLAWHWRAADAFEGEQQADALAEELERALSGLPLEIMRGDKVLEIRPQSVHKGLISGPHAVRTPGKTVIAAGNDRTDEDLFEALAESAITIVVGNRPSAARYRVTDVDALRGFLGQIAA